MLNWASRLGLIQRILCLLIGSALLTVLVVAWSLNELAVLRGYIVAERAAEHRREIIGEAASLSYRAASKFAAVGLDLHPEEQRQHLIDGDAMLREFEAKLPIMRAALQDSLTKSNCRRSTGSSPLSAIPGMTRSRRWCRTSVMNFSST